jgi:mannose-1-phosphate guanylyltransferase
MHKKTKPMNSENLYCVIMAGGIGSRFWPVSTSKFPKQFHDILGMGQSMLQMSYERIAKLIPNENIFVITNHDYIKLVQEQLPQLAPGNIVGEPSLRNTAACNALMAHKIHQINPKAKMVVMPSDHIILKEQAFIDKCQLAFDYLDDHQALITLGISPTRPETGYGYIQYSPESAQQGVYKVKTFTEKPNLELAEAFIATGEFLWNAGIFIWKSKDIIAALDKYLPEMNQFLSQVDFNGEFEQAEIENIYPKLEKISIDNGVMERADNVLVIPSDLGWSDLGTWTSVFENSNKTPENNTENTKNILTYQATGNIIYQANKRKAVVIDGLEDYIVVDTDKALLICPKTNDQLIKNYVLDVKELKKGEDFL